MRAQQWPSSGRAWEQDRTGAASEHCRHGDRRASYRRPPRPFIELLNALNWFCYKPPFETAACIEKRWLVFIGDTEMHNAAMKVDRPTKPLANTAQRWIQHKWLKVYRTPVRLLKENGFMIVTWLKEAARLRTVGRVEKRAH